MLQFSFIHQTNQHNLQRKLAACCGVVVVPGADLLVAVVDAVAEDGEPDEVPHVVLLLQTMKT